jgi:S1-C subfamily serine protease
MVTSPSRSTRTPIVALTAAALLGGGAALGGAALAGALGGGTTTVVEAQPAPQRAVQQPAASRTDLTPGEIYKRSSTAVVQITTSSGGQRQGLGSGFVLDKSGHVVTNYHVVEGGDAIEVSFSNQDTLDATLVGVDPSTDLAVLKVDAGARALTPLPLGDSEAVEVGDPVVAIGNPFGLERTVTAGIVSALQRRVTAPNGFAIDHVIQTDAPINSGNSGGPLINAHGEVIGVNSQIETGGGSGNVGIGFAVPSNTVKSVVGQVLATGTVEHAYLGVGVRDVTPELARQFGLPVDAGVLVERVDSGTGAARAGLRAGSEDVVVGGESYRMGGDVIVAVDGRRISGGDELRQVIAAAKPGDTLKLRLYRGQDEQTVTVTLGRQPANPTP